MKAILRVTQGATTTDVVALKPTTTVGRRRDADLCISVPEVSRDHCVIFQQYDQWIVKDLGSTNGTYVNGEAISERGLLHGDQLVIGPVSFVLECEGMPPIAGRKVPAAELDENEVVLDAEVISEAEIPLAEYTQVAEDGERETQAPLPLASSEECATPPATPSPKTTGRKVVAPKDDEDDELETFLSRMRGNP